MKPVAKPPDPAALLNPKRIVGLTGPGVAMSEDEGNAGVAEGTAIDGAGDAISGLSPALPSSVAPSGIPPLPTEPAKPPPGNGVVPEAVPAVVESPHVAERSIEPALNPEGIALEQALLLAVGSNGDGLSPPGERPVAPNGIPTGPTGAAVPGTPSGDVAPSPDGVGGCGANCAELTLQLRNNAAVANQTARKGTST
ncbi:MAG: hypothetical protein JOZ94_09440 [Xanthobacteraceae bacterium]|nr:hypothetical protein [Xanthobacteraceae bacterium]